MTSRVAGELTTMTWNVENLFEPGAAAGPPDAETYEAKLDYLASIIKAVRPDVVALQEIGDPDAAEALRRRVGATWHLLLSSKPDARGIRVGVLSPHKLALEEELSTLPPEGMPQVPDVDGTTLHRMGRGALQVLVTLGTNRQLRFITAHLKSKLLTFPDNRRYPLDEDERARGAGYALLRRTAEAVALRVHLDEVMASATKDGQPGIPTVLCGDLNDGPEAVTTTLIGGPDDGDPGRPDKGDWARLYNLSDRLPVNRAYSRIFQGRGELIDHQLVSRDLLLRVHTVDSLVENIGSITESITARRPATVPDHAPVVARFTGV